MEEIKLANMMNPYKRHKRAYIGRKLATSHLTSLLERVSMMNKSDNKYDYPHTITNLIVFGSYLSDKEILGDIDVFYSYNSKWLNDGEGETDYFYDKPLRDSWSKSTFNSYYHTRKLLRNNKKSFSFHGISEFEVMKKLEGFRYVYLIKDSVINNQWMDDCQSFFNVNNQTK